jgi:uncharacterized protein (TIGR02678 family)
MSRGDRTPEQYRPYVDLLDHVAVTADTDRAAYNRIRVRFDELRKWFSENPGWHLIESHGVARLIKTPATAGPGQGIPLLRQPLDYEILIWVLWFGEKTETEQFILSHLLEEITAIAGETADGPRLHWKLRSQRESLERAIRALELMGALATVQGDVGEWVRSGEGDTLYEFTGLAQHLHISLSDALYDAVVRVERPASIQELARSSATASERLYRTLLLSTALHQADDPEAFAILRRRDRRLALAEDLKARFGWELEVTDSYAALLRPYADTFGQRAYPGRSAVNHAVLLMMAHLRERVAAREIIPDDHERLMMSEIAFGAEVYSLKERSGVNWGAGLNALSLDALTSALLAEMRLWDMVQGPDQDGYITIMPVAGRFVGVYRAHGEGLEMEAVS